MDALKAAELARALRDAHGAEAPAVAARRIRAYEAKGDATEVANWQRIRNALSVTSPPGQG
ncbi:hypothetical protein [Marimonas lutisalis]|uniref:hypothetical protein n=1 Tax=Marimonas lutisalis TaxID=2545756 RepID=UPI0010F8A251|nr:hypothetical protein [Marimonas lutisalis]